MAQADPTQADPAQARPRDQTGRRMMSGGLRLAASGGAQAIIQLVVLATLGRLLSPSDFGIVAAAGLLVDVMTNLAQLGLGPALVQRRDITAAHIRTAHTFSVAMGLAVTGLLFVCAPFVAHLLRADGATEPMRWLSPTFLLSSIGVVANSIAMRELRFGILARRRFLAYLIGYGLVGITCAAAGMGVWSLVAAQLSQVGLSSLLVIAGVRHSWMPGFDRTAFRQLIGFGMGLSSDKIGAAIANRVDIAIVSRLFGAASLGLYSRAYNLMRFPAMMIGAIIDDVAFPAFSSIQHDAELIRNHFLRSLAILNLCLFAAATTLLVFGREFVLLALGPGWGEAGLLLSVLSLSLPFRSTQRLCAATARAAGAPWAVALCQYLYVVMVAAGAGTGSLWGLEGVAAGVGLAIFGQFAALATVVCLRTGLTVGALVEAHLSALPLALSLATSLILLRWFAQFAGLGEISTMFVAGGVAALIVIAAVVATPALLLGGHGRFLVAHLLKAAPKRVRAGRLHSVIARRIGQA